MLEQQLAAKADTADMLALRSEVVGQDNESLQKKLKKELEAQSEAILVDAAQRLEQ